MIRETVAELAVPSQAVRAGVADLPRELAAHDAYLASLPGMNRVEVGGTADVAPLGFPLNVAAWNLERCLFPEASAEKLRGTGAQLVLLSELDNGMSRTAQRHPTAEMAAMLGMAYAYGVEFLELGLGSDTEREFCHDPQNDRGFHGNALMAATALSQPFMLRLPGERIWFATATDQPRLGERMAMGAVIATTSGPFVAISTHLESVADSAYRAAQMRHIIDRAEAAFPGLPILIGGDLNTGNNPGGHHATEALFPDSIARGFTVHGGPETQMTTRPSLITRWPERAMKLDWFLSRGLDIATSAIIPSTDPEGRVLSDHDLITCTITGFSA